VKEKSAAEKWEMSKTKKEILIFFIMWDEVRKIFPKIFRNATAHVINKFQKSLGQNQPRPRPIPRPNAQKSSPSPSPPRLKARKKFEHAQNRAFGAGNVHKWSLI
jgi:hypothetical protein